MAEYLQKAVSNGNCWRFGGLVFYTLSILRNQKGLFQEPPAVWIDFQEPEEVGVVISHIAMTKVFINVDSKSKYFAASCGKVRWDDACVAEYLQKAVSNGNCWRFGFRGKLCSSLAE